MTKSKQRTLIFCLKASILTMLQRLKNLRTKGSLAHVCKRRNFLAGFRNKVKIEKAD